MEPTDDAARELADLRRHWGFAYRLTCEHGRFRAVRRADGSAVSGASAAELEHELQEDYRLRPPPVG
jgi:hypothetical protein